MKKILLLFSFFCLSLYAGQENSFVNPQDQALQAIFNEMDEEIGFQEFATELQHNRARTDQALQDLFPTMEVEGMEMEVVAPDTNPQGHARSLPPASDEMDEEIEAQEFVTPLEQEPDSFPLENDTAQADQNLQDLFPGMEAEEMEMEVVAPDTNPQGHARSLPPAPRAQERPHQCTWPRCNKTFTISKNLTRHKRIHTGKKLYQCTWPRCNKAFINSSNLKAHERTHTGEKPYQCTWQGCNKAFAQQSNLEAHERRTHTGEKPYQCQHCEKAFAELGPLKAHERTHTGEKPYQCQHCEKAFTTKGILTEHLRTHTGEKPYQCKYCNKGFTTSSNRTKHEKNSHNEEQ